MGIGRREVVGGAKKAALSSGIGASDLSLQCDDLTGWPTGAVGKFPVIVNRGLSNEEKLWGLSRSGNTITVQNVGDRGVDGTADAPHDAGASVEHGLFSAFIDESNEHANATADAHPATAVSYGGSAGLSATTVEGALDELDAEKSAVGHTHAITKTIRVPHTWTVAGEVKVASGDTDFICPFFLPEPSGQTVRIVGARHRINSGTSATAKLQLDGVDVAGFTGISVTTASATTDPADVDVTDGQRLALVVTGVSGTPRNMTFTVWLEYAV